MPVTRRHTLGVMAVAGSSAFKLREIENCEITPGISQLENWGAGEAHRGFVATGQVAPMISASTREIVRFLTNVSPLNGLALPDLVNGSTYTDVTVYAAKKLNKGTRAGATSHYSLNTASAMIVPKTLTMEVGREAMLAFEIHPISSNGTTAPWEYANNVSLPGSLPDFEKFMPGGVTLNGTTIDGVQGITVDFGIGVTKAFANGDIYPTHVAIQQNAPTIEVRTLDITSLGTWGVAGTAATGVAATIYGQKLANMGTRTADATAEHLKITLSASQFQVTAQPFSAGNNDDYTGSIRITPITGSAAIWAMAAAAIT